MIRVGDRGSKMYFVAEGTLEVQTGHGPDDSINVHAESKTSKSENLSLFGSNIEDILGEHQVSERRDATNFANRR